MGAIHQSARLAYFTVKDYKYLSLQDLIIFKIKFFLRQQLFQSTPSFKEAAKLLVKCMPIK